MFGGHDISYITMFDNYSCVQFYACKHSKLSTCIRGRGEGEGPGQNGPLIRPLGSAPASCLSSPPSFCIRLVFFCVLISTLLPLLFIAPFLHTKDFLQKNFLPIGIPKMRCAFYRLYESLDTAEHTVNASSFIWFLWCAFFLHTFVVHVVYPNRLSGTMYGWGYSTWQQNQWIFPTLRQNFAPHRVRCRFRSTKTAREIRRTAIQQWLQMQVNSKIAIQWYAVFLGQCWKPALLNFHCFRVTKVRE